MSTARISLLTPPNPQPRSDTVVSVEIEDYSDLEQVIQLLEKAQTKKQNINLAANVATISIAALSAIIAYCQYDQGHKLLDSLTGEADVLTASYQTTLIDRNLGSFNATCASWASTLGEYLNATATTAAEYCSNLYQYATQNSSITCEKFDADKRYGFYFSEMQDYQCNNFPTDTLYPLAQNCKYIFSKFCGVVDSINITKLANEDNWPKTLFFGSSGLALQVFDRFYSIFCTLSSKDKATIRQVAEKYQLTLTNDPQKNIELFKEKFYLEKNRESIAVDHSKKDTASSSFSSSSSRLYRANTNTPTIADEKAQETKNNLRR